MARGVPDFGHEEILLLAQTIWHAIGIHSVGCMRGRVFLMRVSYMRLPLTVRLHAVCMLASTIWFGAMDTGGQGRNRTTDTRIFSPLLYQLSYLATFPLRNHRHKDFGFG